MLFIFDAGRALRLQSRQKALIIILLGTWTLTFSLANAQSEEALERFGGEYRQLSEGQQRILDDIFRRAGQLVGEELDPESYYDRLRLSVRTTYDAVTDALEKSQLTDQSGSSLGTALDLIQHMETVQGKAEGARGDQQFRIYVRLIPDARDKLDRSQEFDGKKDNSRYHQGYPLNYRQTPKEPSIQISMTRDGQRADIDVDYRSAKFPQALFNGHLTAANSDVRAGDNHERHVSRWSGLVDWWKDFFGLPLGEDQEEPEEDLKEKVPAVPRAGKEKIEIAARDFLTLWLSEQKPTEALAYFSDRAYHCMELKYGQEDEPFDFGMAPLQMWMGMKGVNQTLGRVDNLAEVVKGVRFARPELSVIEQPFHGEFVLYGIPDHVAARFDCANRLRVGIPPEKPSKPQRKFNYFATIFYLQEGDTKGATLVLMWAKEQDYWRIVSYEVDPGASEERTNAPDLRPIEAGTTVRRQSGDPEVIAAVDRLYETWLVKKDYKAAFNTFLPQCYPCINLYLEENEKSEKSRDQGKRLREALSNLGDRLGAVKNLADKIRGVESWDPSMREIIHGREKTYSIYSIPEWMAEDGKCQNRVEGKEASPKTEENSSYGRYFGSGFTVRTVAGEAATLWLGWTKEKNQWRVFAFEVEAP